MKRILTALVAAAALLIVVLPARPAGADPVADEAQFLTLLNQVRAERGARPLAIDGQLVSIARQWSARMASEGTLFHNDDLSSQVSNWRMIGENVGVGTGVVQLHNAFVASPHHFENMIEPAFDYVGVGVVMQGSQMWVTVDFKQAKTTVNTTAAAAPAPAPKPAPAPRPAPAPKPKLAPAPAPKPAAAPVAKPAAPATTVAPAPPVEAAAPSTTVAPEVAGAAFGWDAAVTQPTDATPVATNLGAGMVALALLAVVAHQLRRVRASR